MTDQVNEALETLTQYSAEHGHPADFEAAISALSALTHPSRGVVDEDAVVRANTAFGKYMSDHMHTHRNPEGPSIFDDAMRAALQAAALPTVPVEMSPEFTDTARAALAWVLYHHQGGSSPVGQAIRFALGMGQHDEMGPHRVSEAKRWAAICGQRTSDFHAPQPAVPSVPSVPEGMVSWEVLRNLIDEEIASWSKSDHRREVTHAMACLIQRIAAAPKDQPAQGVDG